MLSFICIHFLKHIFPGLLLAVKCMYSVSTTCMFFILCDFTKNGWHRPQHYCPSCWWKLLSTPQAPFPSTCPCCCARGWSSTRSSLLGCETVDFRDIWVCFGPHRPLKDKLNLAVTRSYLNLNRGEVGVRRINVLRMLTRIQRTWPLCAHNLMIQFFASYWYPPCIWKLKIKS